MRIGVRTTSTSFLQINQHPTCHSPPNYPNINLPSLPFYLFNTLTLLFTPGCASLPTHLSSLFSSTMNPFSYKLCFFLFFFFPIFLSSHAILHPIDFLALQSLRKTLSDLPGSHFFSSWEFTSDPCHFAGVYCLDDRVIALNLGDPRAGFPGLTGRLHPAIGKLSALSEFTLVPGRVFGCLPPSLSQLKNLIFLSVSRNYFSGHIPSGLGDLRGLRTLDLSFNQLSGRIPPAIGTLPALSNVLLCHNRLSGTIPRFASPTLTRLDLKHNDLSGSLSPLGLPPSLQYLSLSWNRLTGNVDRTLSRLNKLNWLDLSMNLFTGSIPSQLFSFPITSLQLQRNQFSGMVQPADEVTIQTVDLSYNRFWGKISPKFSTVQNLYLNNNRFSGEVPSSLVEQLMSSGMEVLYLQHNYLTGMEIDPTAEIPASSSLCMQYNCMVLRVRTACPLRAGKQRTRAAAQCVRSGKDNLGI